MQEGKMSESNQQQTKQLPPGKDNLNGFEYVSTRFDALIQHGITPDDIRAPAFWANHGKDLRPLDEIRARAEDGTWIANLIVLDSSRTWAKVQVMNVTYLSTADVSESQAVEKSVESFVDQHKIIHRGKRRWSVIRYVDGAVLAEDIVDRNDAVKWLVQHAKSQQVAVVEPA
jgi:hypothetical protein